MLYRRQFTLAGLAAAAVDAQAPAAPNVLLILCERWRRQSIPGAEETDLIAPALLRLQAESVAFTRAYTSNPAADPARASIQTGRLSHGAGVPWNGKPLAADIPSIVQIFQQAGYALAGERPPFLRVVRYGLPAGASGRYKPGELHVRDNVPLASEPVARERIAAYDASCTALDEQLGRLLATVPENTITVFTSAHGEMLGSHGLAGAGVWYEESIGVPLLLRWPGKVEAGRKVDWLMSHIDLGPTLLGLCRLPPLEDAHGADHSALLLAGKGEEPNSLYVQGRLGTAGEWRSVVRGYDKLVVDRAVRPTHLYNLAQDPQERNNLALDRASVRRQEELVALMRRWIVKTGDRIPYPGRAPAEE